MPKGVSCSVANCSFWGQGNECHANAIHIDIDSHASKNLDNEFASESLGDSHKDTAADSAFTCCHTFKPKE
ncbi:DUF1540 domain-containing protein [Paenibacillus mendelii]|uniref:DUF1540 domain-containing protein n=1 Tax=Paenibacillus mendelii TaxID=206163 RepID=A0ABV6JIU8_9BACL|nr:DUF1540 domain-containing protein [Paenibacillus mendelii]MCQ6558302.1 DUF1540 domain-containing protein [Paenibacillus mendelii]